MVTTDDNGYKAMDYPKMTSILLGAVKELKAENENLKARIEKLEKIDFRPTLFVFIMKNRQMCVDITSGEVGIDIYRFLNEQLFNISFGVLP